MGKFISNFQTTAELESFSGTTNFQVPHVSLTKRNRQVHFFDIYNGHEYVDLGLPSGTLWATMNVGANSETDYGLYFQWGDVQGYTADQVGNEEGKKYFGWVDYKYGNGTSEPSATGMTKYNSTDGKTVLDLEDDAARANWGGGWRMPTNEEIRELLNSSNCTSVFTTVNGIRGRLFTSVQNSNTLFFPAAGRASSGSMSNINYIGDYWSSTLFSDVDFSNNLNFYTSAVQTTRSYRFYGYSVRGVVG